MQYGTRNTGLKKPALSDASLITDLNDNIDIIDSIIAKCNFNASSDPTIYDDVNDGYSIGSIWVNILTQTIFLCAINTVGAAIWKQVSNGIIGPSSSINNNLVAFNGATGKMGKDSGVSAANGHIAILHPAEGSVNEYLRLGTYLQLQQAYYGGNAFIGFNARLSTSDATTNKFVPAYSPGKGFVLRGDFIDRVRIHAIDWGSSSAEKTYPTDFTQVLNLDYLGNLTVPALKDTKLGQSQHYVTVGPHAWCDYVTDGTDDQVQLQAALTDGGTGIIVVVAGLLNITAGSHPYTTAIGQSIIGTGWGIEDNGTSYMGLQLVGAGAGPVFEIKHRQTKIKNLSINGGHTSGQAGCYGIKWATQYAWQSIIDHCYIFRCGDSGIYVNLEGSAMASVIKNCQIRKIFAADGWSAGIEILNTNDLKGNSIEISECPVGKIITGTSAANIFNNCHYWPYYTDGYDICIYIDSSGPGNQITNSYFDNHFKSVIIESNANHNLISGCYAAGLNKANSIGVTLNGNYNRIVNNSFPYESNIVSAMEINGGYNIIIGNIVHGKPINDYGAGNEKAHNI